MNKVFSRGLVVLPLAGLGAFLAAAQWSCSSSPEAVAATDYASVTAEAYCGSLKTCCDGKKLEFDPDSCKTQIAYEIQTMIDTTKRGRVAFDGVAGKKCQDALAARVKQCVGGAEDAGAAAGDPLGDICRTVFVGSVKAGSECSTDLDCATKATNERGVCRVDDRKDADPNKKICFVVATKVVKGQDCTIGLPKDDFESRECAGYCDTQQGADDEHGKCQDFAAKGDVCVDTSTPNSVSYRACAQGQYCSPTTRKCTEAPGEGRDCAPGYSGISGKLSRFCAADLFCAPELEGPGTCTTVSGTGEACTGNLDCFSGVCNFQDVEADAGVDDSGAGVPGGTVRLGRCAAPVITVEEDEVSKPYEVSARTCAFGPDAVGPIDQGVAKKSLTIRNWWKKL